MRKIRRKERKSILQAFLFIVPFIGGGFWEWSSCLASIVLLGILIAGQYFMEKPSAGLVIAREPAMMTSALLVIFYGLSCFWAVDRGMAILGLVKFLPLPLFLLALGQEKAENRNSLWEAVWQSGVLMTVLSFFLSRFSRLTPFFLVNERLAGFFQYPNTFALFLLAGIVVLAEDEIWDKRRLAGAGILLFGILQSGSRTVFFLTVVILLAYIFILKDRKKRLFLFFLLAGIVAVTGSYVLLTGNVSTIGRYLTTSFGESTFLGRLLYFKDALPVILKHPFGLGYLGYSYTQGSFQTGVYSVMHIHNELLQFLLDVGWLPGLAFAAAVARGLFRRTNSRRNRMLLLVIFAHAMFDFDLQFLAIDFLLLLAMEEEGDSVRQKKWVLSRRAFRLTACALALLSLWLGLASGFYWMGSPETALFLYPGCTGAWVDLLPLAKSAEEMEEIADQIIARNPSVSLAYSAKARSAYVEGDFGEMIRWKQEAIALARYQLEEYLDYFDMLEVGIQLYEEYGDYDSAAYCRERLREIPAMLEAVRAGTDGLAWRLRDKPELELPEEYQERYKEIFERKKGD